MLHSGALCRHSLRPTPPGCPRARPSAWKEGSRTGQCANLSISCWNGTMRFTSFGRLSVENGLETKW
eukprot:1259485-Pyramimonas_sp.AAC.1